MFSLSPYPETHLLLTLVVERRGRKEREEVLFLSGAQTEVHRMSEVEGLKYQVVHVSILI